MAAGNRWAVCVRRVANSQAIGGVNLPSQLATQCPLIVTKSCTEYRFRVQLQWITVKNYVFFSCHLNRPNSSIYLCTPKITVLPGFLLIGHTVESHIDDADIANKSAASR